MDDNTVVLDYSSLLEFAAELERSPETVLPFATKAMEESVAVIQDSVATYPPETAANAPGRVDKHGRPMGYYERGKGWWRPLIRPTTVLAHGTMAGGKYGKSIGRGVYVAKGVHGNVAGYKLDATSEQLGKSWTSAVDVVEAGGVIGTVGTMQTGCRVTAKRRSFSQLADRRCVKRSKKSQIRLWASFQQLSMTTCHTWQRSDTISLTSRILTD